MTTKIELTIQEIVNDFYSLAEEEGYYTGLCEGFNLSDEDFIVYHEFMKELIEKYIPNYKKHIDKEYFDKDISESEKGCILSKMLIENFQKMFYNLV